ncbi:MAG: hypothetical protein QOI54_313 [Actinomycetota bacterium]|nr:hypothetical protein [Actinomycetota bacterium]
MSDEAAVRGSGSGLLDDVTTAQRLARWLGASALPGGGDVTVRRHGEGHSNLTYVVARGGRDWILRRPPAGPLLPTAHDVVREYRVLDLLGRADPPVRVPRVVAVCEDTSVLGVPFYLMERVEGTVVRGALPPWLDERGQRALGLDVADALAELHRASPEPFAAAGLGRASGYLHRQVRRWVGQREGIQAAAAAEGGRARALPDYDAVRDWLRGHLPPESAPAVVHGDYKLDNVIVAGTRVAAIVDWEMATVGDPRADLGYLVSCWAEPGERYPLPGLATSGPGFPTRAQLVARWESASGREAGDLRWFVTLAAWKLAVLLEASYHRHLAGTTDDPFFATLEDGVPALLAHAREVCGA